MLYSYLLTLMILWVKKQLELYETDLRNGCWFTKCLPAASVASATTTVGYTKFLLSCCLLHNTVAVNLQWTVKPTTSAVVVEKIWWLRATVAIQASAYLVTFFIICFFSCLYYYYYLKQPKNPTKCVSLLIYFVLRPHLCDLLLKDSMVQQIAISSRKKREENGNKPPEKKEDCCSQFWTRYICF